RPLSTQRTPCRVSERQDDADRRDRQHQPRRSGDSPWVMYRTGVRTRMSELPANQVGSGDREQENRNPITQGAHGLGEQKVLRVRFGFERFGGAVLGLALLGRNGGFESVPHFDY